MSVKRQRVSARDLRPEDLLLGSDRRVVAVEPLSDDKVRVTTRRGEQETARDWNARTTVTILRPRHDP